MTTTEAGPRKRGQQTTCSHHWIIEPHAGPISRGVCKRCGAETEFRNYLPYSSWQDDGSKTRKPRGLSSIDLN